MRTRVAIYGFDRLGRAVYHLAARRSDIDVVMIVSDDSPEEVVNALAADVIYASLNQEYELRENAFVHNTQHVHVRPIKTVGMWQDHDIDIIIDTITTDATDKAFKLHQKSSARRVVFAAKSSDESLPEVVVGSTEDLINAKLSALSAGGPEVMATRPVTDVIKGVYGVQASLAQTVDGMLCASACQCERDCGCCVETNIPAPALVASVTQLTLLCRKQPEVKDVVKLLKSSAKEAYYQGILAVSEAPIGSDEVVGESTSAVVDLTRAKVEGKLLSLVVWYDREWACANRLVEITADLGRAIHRPEKEDK